MSQVKNLTRLGSDTRKIAALLQAKAPKGEMLAYISPQEAALLKARGGSGKPHADTGIPSFQNPDDPFGWYNYSVHSSSPEFDTALTYSPASTSEQNAIRTNLEFDRAVKDLRPESRFDRGATSFVYSPRLDPFGEGYDFSGTTSFNNVLPAAPVATTQPQAPFSFTPPEQFTPNYSFAREAAPGIPFASALGSTSAPSAPTGGRQQAEPGMMSTIGKALGLEARDVPLLGLAGVQALLGSRQAGRARAQGQAARREMEAMAAPYRQKGEQLQAQAARGELTPQSQQALAAAQAQAAQSASARGGVGAAQVANQMEALRQQLLQSQADYGLKLSGIGDQIALGAIREGMQADQFVNQLTSSYMNNIMRTVGAAYGQREPMIVLGGGR